MQDLEDKPNSNSEVNPLFNHNSFDRSKTQAQCSVCGLPLCEHGHCAKEIEPCTACAPHNPVLKAEIVAYEDFFEADFCPTCGSPICSHGICSANYCGHDHQCLECLDRRNLEQDAEDNFRYYKGCAEALRENE